VRGIARVFGNGDHVFGNAWPLDGRVNSVGSAPRVEARVLNTRDRVRIDQIHSAVGDERTPPDGRQEGHVLSTPSVLARVNQREGLRRFLEDGRLPIQGQLSNLAMGRDNWRYFLNRTGLDWYTTFRSLIASCHLHSINPQLYLEEILRLAPHWPALQMLQLSPKYWQQTRSPQPRAARDHSLALGQVRCLSDSLR
jgi:hypothetical protein